jgi:hypothetical protein
MIYISSTGFNNTVWFYACMCIHQVSQHQVIAAVQVWGALMTSHTGALFIETTTFGCLTMARFTCIKIRMFCKYRYCKEVCPLNGNTFRTNSKLWTVLRADIDSPLPIRDKFQRLSVKWSSVCSPISVQWHLLILPLFSEKPKHPLALSGRPFLAATFSPLPPSV